MKRKPSRGIPAAAILAGGISRHGRHCYCRICVDNRKDDEAQASLNARLDAHFEKFAPAIAAINVGFAKTGGQS